MIFKVNSVAVAYSYRQGEEAASIQTEPKLTVGEILMLAPCTQPTPQA
jgi:hypothetical protein